MAKPEQEKQEKQEKPEKPKIRIEIQQEVVCIDRSARARIYCDGTLVTEVFGKVGHQQGADGGWYPCVELTEQPIQKPEVLEEQPLIPNLVS